ncbi:uncharacterized protein N7484_006359 [Penicillium longicatenatum]|uniref:uncharacterized protein n=1 Tax=Penicillium longicatenatum TaxID=1561947 RepID=UPI002547E8CA|nr:uncharacterized protein N7484_006359 [Penicillium longicatenatum]KAJ5643852.1 hypothetical protein N7484_006359 [Penicillium longicatenatum]
MWTSRIQQTAFCHKTYSTPKWISNFDIDGPANDRYLAVAVTSSRVRRLNSGLSESPLLQYGAAGARAAVLGTCHRTLTKNQVK